MSDTSRARRFAFLWFTVYGGFFFFCATFLFPGPLAQLPFLPDLATMIDTGWATAGAHVARALFGIDAQPSGSYDGTWGQLMLAARLAGSGLIAGVLILVGRPRSFERFQTWALAGIRFALAHMMICYAVVKIYPVQFG